MTGSAGGNSLVISEFPGRLVVDLVANPSPDPEPPRAGGRIALTELFRIAEWQDEIPWKPFRDGVEIHRLYGDGITGPTAALIRFRHGGCVPLHEHTGYEHIIVLSGSQQDDYGPEAAGTLIVSAPGTQHHIVSEGGCIVLAIYEKPVRFIAEALAAPRREG